MKINNHKRPIKKLYWVNTDGYFCKFLPLLYGNDGWIVTSDDRTLFLSDYKLQLLFGKKCILREVNIDTDILTEDPIKNSFFPLLLNSGDHHTVFMTHPTLNISLHNGMIIPKPEVPFLGYLHYPEDDSNGQ
jgi:hypothetical protein